MTILPEDLENLLEAERDIDVPAPAQRQRMFARLQPLLIVPVALAAGSSSVATAADAAGSAAVGGFLKGKVAAAVVSAALMGGAVGATGHAYFASPVSRSTGATIVPAAPGPPVPSIAPEQAPSAPDAPAAAASAAAAPSQSGGRQERSPAVGPLRAERLLLEAASAALMRGDSESAILALRKHAQRFPNGALAEEREALLERALAASRKPR
jgi:hypothetical protein